MTNLTAKERRRIRESLGSDDPMMIAEAEEHYAAEQAKLDAPSKPKIELKAIKVLTSMSEETHCYEAKLYVDGEYWGRVGNAGHGGCDDFHPANGKTRDDLHNLNLRIAQTYPADDSYGITIECDVEQLCCEEVNAFLRKREYKRILKKPTFIKDGEVRYFSVPRGWTLDKTLAQVRRQKPDIALLNDLPFEEAAAKLREAGV